jgi:phenylpropionate dioxygenase-like ring-hydroxylating dioxygenase large terminal subunit
VYWYRILPTGPETSSLLTTMLIRPEAKEIADYEAILQREIQAGIDFHMEDMEMCTATQRGMKSAGYGPGRLSHLEETIWQLQRYLARVIQRDGGNCPP